MSFCEAVQGHAGGKVYLASAIREKYDKVYIFKVFYIVSPCC